MVHTDKSEDACNYSKFLKNASTGTLKAVGEILRRNPDDVILPIMNNVYSTLLTGCCTYLEVFLTFFI